MPAGRCGFQKHLAKYRLQIWNLKLRLKEVRIPLDLRCWSRLIRNTGFWVGVDRGKCGSSVHVCTAGSSSSGDGERSAVSPVEMVDVISKLLLTWHHLLPPASLLSPVLMNSCSSDWTLIMILVLISLYGFLLNARWFGKLFMWIITFNLYNIPIWKVPL